MEHQTSTQVDLKLDMSTPLNQFFNHLTNWSLMQIRCLYASFRKRHLNTAAQSVYLLRHQFCNIMPFSSINGRFIFDQWTRNQASSSVINFIEILCALVLTSHSNS